MKTRAEIEADYDKSAHLLDPHHTQKVNGHKVPADLSDFFCVTVISNPKRYKRRYELYWKFIEQCQAAGVQVITVEQAFGERPFMVTSKDNPYHVQVKSFEELWLKENMMNIGIQHGMRLFSNKATKVAWIDADCRPSMPMREWFQETWHALQHYEFVQMWSSMIDLDVNNEPIGVPQTSFMYNYIKHGSPHPVTFHELNDAHSYMNPSSTKLFGRPGLAWAANVTALNHVGGLIEHAVLGSGDWFQAHALLGTLKEAQGEYSYGPYMAKMMDWQDRATHFIKRDVGYVPAMMLHDFHGRKSLRQYGTRGSILNEAKFNPDIDLKKDASGLYQLNTISDRQIKLRDDIRMYFTKRNEDSIDLE